MAKRKTLPKDFENTLKAGDISAMKAVFDKCEIDARGGYSKQSALAFNACPDELTKWLVAQGADVAAEDIYGETPLHARARCWDGNLSVLLELGAPVDHGEGGRGTALHSAAGAFKPSATEQLLAHGADANALNSDGQTPLVYALQRCRNIDIESVVSLTQLLLPRMTGAGQPSGGFQSRLLGGGRAASPVTPQMQAQVTRIGTDFEFSRSAFNPESVDAVSAALEALYRLYDVPAVPRRAMHDGKSPIKAKAEHWADQHDELWALLVPAQGKAPTVQGEVVRISGRLHRELAGNGGINWDADFAAMAAGFLSIVKAGRPLPHEDLEDAKRIVAQVKRRHGDTERLCQLAVAWVALNPTPQPLSEVAYRR